MPDVERSGKTQVGGTLQRWLRAVFYQIRRRRKARCELAEFLEQLHQRECPQQPLREFRHGCTRMAKLWLKANDPHYPFLH